MPDDRRQSGDGEIVVVSPHLDDAVLSASLQLSRPGARLVTVCAGVPPEDAPLGWWDRLTGAASAAGRVRERLREDDAARTALGGVPSTRLGFPDGQHLEHAPSRPDLAAMIEALGPELAGAAEIWAPAGIGCHPDHLATRDAAIAAAPGVVVQHYADVPYAVRYGWPPSVTGAPARAYLDLELWLGDELAQTALADRSPGRELVRTVHVLDDAARRRKAAALAAYVTQIPGLDYGDWLATGSPGVIGYEVSWRSA